MRKLALSLTFLVALFVTGTFSQNNDGLRVEHRIIDRMIDILGNNSETAPPAHGHASAPPVGSTGNTTALRYHNGPVINTPTIYIIWYGNWNQTNGTDTAGGQQIIRDWASNIGNSDYFRINASYSQKPPSGTAIYGGEHTYSGSITTTSLSDANILSIVNGSIGGTGGLPYNASGVYMVVTSSNVNESSGFCTQYCGWHTDGTANSGHVRYAFVGNAARCITSCAIQSTSPNGNPGVDGAISVLSHELEEATTDPDLNAWYDSRGAENGDKCAWTFGNSYVAPNGSYANLHLGNRDFLIQRNLFYTGSAWRCARTNAGGQ